MIIPDDGPLILAGLILLSIAIILFLIAVILHESETK